MGSVVAPGSDGTLRIALYSPVWPPGTDPNGIVTYVSQILPALRERGVEVSVIAGRIDPGHADPPARLPVPVREGLRGRLLARLRPEEAAARRYGRALAAQLRRLAAEEKVQLVEMEESFGWCGTVAEEAGVPVVARLHGPWFLNGALLEDPGGRPYRERVRREGQALRRVAGITAPSADVLERTLAEYGPLPRHRVIFNGLEPMAPADAWDPGACDPATLLFVGRFDAHKGGDVAIDAFARVRTKHPDARLCFVGPDRGVLDAQGRRCSLEDWIQERLSPADREAVERLGVLTGPEIRALRRRASVTFLASRYEIFGYTLAEAMAQGCPIVATDTGGLPELVEDGRSALLARPGDAESLAATLCELLARPERAAAMGRQARADFEERLRPEAVAAETEAFYREVLESKGSMPGGEHGG